MHISKNKILQIIYNLHKEAPKILAAIEYGSKQRDRDIFVITDSGGVHSCNDKDHDLLIVSLKEAKHRIQWKDIAFTEPVSVGFDEIRNNC